MKNTIRNRLVAALVLASFGLCSWAVADEVSRVRLGSLRKNDLVVVDVQRGVDTNAVQSLILEYDKTVVRPREDAIASGGCELLVTSVNGKTGDVVLAVGDIPGTVSRDELDEDFASFIDGTLKPELQYISSAVVSNFNALYRFGSNNFASAYRANERAWRLETWQYTNSVARTDFETGFTPWAVTPVWAVGRFTVARISSGVNAGKWSLFRPGTVEYSDDNSFVSTPIEASDAVTHLVWPSQTVNYVDNGTNASVVIDIEARRTKLMDMADYAKIVYAGSDIPDTGWAFQPSESYSLMTNYTGAVVTTVVNGVTSTSAVYTVATNRYAVLSLYRDGAKVWTSDPADSSNAGWLITLALLLTGGAGAFAWRNYASKSYVDELVNYKPISISAFTVSPSEREVGGTVSEVVLAYELSKEAELATLDGSPVALSGKSGSINVSGLSLTSSKTWSLRVVEPESAAAAVAAEHARSATLSFRWRRHWGVASADVSAVTDEFLNGVELSGELSTGRSKSFTVTAGSGQYIWYAVPASFGACSFKVGGFDGGFTLVKTFSHTNSSGGVTDYNVYRSDNQGLGTTTVNVS